MDAARRAFRLKVNKAYKQQAVVGASFEQFGERMLDEARGKPKQLTQCNAADQCAWSCIFNNDFDGTQKCLAAQCSCELDIFDKEYTCTADCVSQCINSSFTWNELDACKENTCQCKQDFDRLATSVDSFFKPQSLFQTVQNAKSSNGAKLGLLLLIVVSGVAAVAYTMYKVNKITKKQKSVKKEKKQESKSSLVTEKDDETFTVSEPYEQVM